MTKNSHLIVVGIKPWFGQKRDGTGAAVQAGGATRSLAGWLSNHEGIAYVEVNPSRMAYLVSSATLRIFNLTMIC